MTVEVLQPLSILCFILGGVLLLLAIALFFLFKIPKIYSELSGAAARKAIEAIREQSEENGGSFNLRRASKKAVVAEISPSGTLQQRASGIEGAKPAKSGRISESSRMRKSDSQKMNRRSVPEKYYSAPDAQQQDYDTQVAGYDSPNEGTTILEAKVNETSVLQAEYRVTTTKPVVEEYNYQTFRIERELGYMESREIIE